MWILEQVFSKDATLFEHICHHICHLDSPLSNVLIRGESKCDDKYVVKVFKWSELHLSEMTCSKIHTLGSREIDLGTFTSTPSDY